VHYLIIFAYLIILRCQKILIWNLIIRSFQRSEYQAFFDGLFYKGKRTGKVISKIQDSFLSNEIFSKILETNANLAIAHNKAKLPFVSKNYMLSESTIARHVRNGFTDQKQVISNFIGPINFRDLIASGNSALFCLNWQLLSFSVVLSSSNELFNGVLARSALECLDRKLRMSINKNLIMSAAYLDPSVMQPLIPFVISFRDELLERRAYIVYVIAKFGA